MTPAQDMGWELEEARMGMTVPDDDELDYCKLCGTACVELCADGTCIECNHDAADGVEGDDDMENDNGSAAVMVKDMTEVQLVALRNAIDIELRTRVELHERLAKAARQALSGTKPRATRKDAGLKRGPKAVVAA